MYDPTIGRFLSIDPASPNGVDILYEHPFVYARNNPVNLIDPSGRQPQNAGPPFFFEGKDQKCTPREENCIKDALQLAINLLKMKTNCFADLLKKCGSSCKSPELTECILGALQQTRYTCADPGVGNCHATTGHPKNDAHSDTRCGKLKSNAAAGEVWPGFGIMGPPTSCPLCKHPEPVANNCSLCDEKTYGEIRTWLCRKRAPGDFGGGIDT
jgi:hypothetical protein